MSRSIATVGIASCLGGNHPDCGLGPQQVRQSALINAMLADHDLALDWQAVLTPSPALPVNAAVTDLCRQASDWSCRLIAARRPFLFIGGDHSYAMGIWKGAMLGLADNPMALLWVDAHMDAHTPATTPSGNLHGMPVAGLLGTKHTELEGIYGGGPHLDARFLALLGVRSYEPAEETLLKQNGVKWCPAVDFEAGASAFFELTANQSVGISIDLDGLDPREAPAVGSPVSNGLAVDDLCRLLHDIAMKKQCIGLELAEFSPPRDHEQKTEVAIARLITAVFKPSVEKAN